MGELAPCPRCRRHIAVETVACPFCRGATQRSGVGKLLEHGARLSRAAVFGGAAACYTTTAPAPVPPPPPPPPNDPGPQDTAPPVEPPPPVDSQPQDAGFSKPPPGTSSGALEGRLFNRNTQRGIAGVPVTASPESGGAQITTKTDANGNFAFANLPIGMYLVMLEFYEHPRKGPLQSRVNVSAGSVARTEFNVTPYVPPSNPSNIPMPYGAPPARRRVT
jgi:hypothetical protein